MTRTLTFLALLAFSLPAAAATVLECERLVDVDAGKVLKNQEILVEGNRIAAVGKSVDAPDDAERIALGSCMPGLMDMHVHLDMQMSPQAYIKRFQANPTDYALMAAHYAKKTLMAGFTTVRNPGDSFNSTIALRNAIDEGFAVGPRIYSAGKSLATTGGHADPTNSYRFDMMGRPGPDDGVLNGAASAREAVRQRYKDGADFIKITATGGVLSLAKSGMNPQFVDEELEAVIATATDYGMHVAAHAHGAEGMKRAVRAGVRSIEHGTFMDDETIDLMKRNGTFYVPTILAGRFVAEKAGIDGYFPDIVRPKAAAVGPQIQDTFEKAWKAGVRIAFGTDCGVSPHGGNGMEFVYMVEGGMPEMDAIRSATLTAAELLGVEKELGSISAGKLADIVAVEGDPLDDISLLTEVSFVMKDGHVYKVSQ